MAAQIALDEIPSVPCFPATGLAGNIRTVLTDSWPSRWTQNREKRLDPIQPVAKLAVDVGIDLIWRRVLCMEECE